MATRVQWLKHVGAMMCRDSHCFQCRKTRTSLCTCLIQRVGAERFLRYKMLTHFADIPVDRAS